MAGQYQLPNPVPTGFTLGIDCTNLEVIDPLSLASNFIIPANTAFNVVAKFVIGGWLAPFLHGTNKAYEVKYYYEGLGGMPDGVLGTHTGNNSGDGVLIDPINTVYEYSGARTSVTVAGGLPTRGIYKLSAVVTFADPTVKLTGFVEGPMIQIS